jgi:head-tail adaptor
MRAGKRNTPVEILVRMDTVDAIGQPSTEFVVWRQIWAEFTPLRGGETREGSEVLSQPTANFRFDWWDVMEPDSGGSVLTTAMLFRVDGLLFDIDVIHADRNQRSQVRCIGVQKRLGV